MKPAFSSAVFTIFTCRGCVATTGSIAGEFNSGSARPGALLLLAVADVVTLTLTLGALRQRPKERQFAPPPITSTLESLDAKAA